MLWLAHLQRKIDKIAEEMCHLTQDDQDRRPQHRELRQDSPINEDEWYDDFHHGNFAFDDASPLAAELQAMLWQPSHKPPQLRMYDGHSDSKQFLMSYEATISSYGGNTAVIAKSFIMVVRSVAHTWYSSLQLGTITSWQKLKDTLVTSFQGFQTNLVNAKALFQCTQDHEEYMQAYVRRFLRLRAQAPTVPNEIVIEAMIKGLRPGPTTQYFARKPPHTLEKLLQKMDEYIRDDNDFCQRREEAYRYSEMTRGFRRRVHPRHVRTIHSPNANDDRANNAQSSQHSSQSSGMQQTSYRPPASRGRGGEASEEGMVVNLGNYSIYSVAKTRDIPQGCAKSRSRSRRKSLKPENDRISPSRSCILLRATLRISRNTSAINSLQLLLLRQVILKLPGLSCHHHHHWHLP
jgi:hypothetical protein